MRERGYECVHVGEVGMSTAADEEILAYAFARRSTVVTLDADFHAILAVSGAVGPSVIRFRMQGLRATALADCLLLLLDRFAGELEAGSLLTVKAQKTTCHMLPIGERRAHGE
jgi:predicted nuclease of predicted toxin-antitoxin system